MKKCKVGGELTNTVFNINLKATPICEECARRIFLQQATWYSQQEFKNLALPQVSKCEGVERRNLLIDFGNQVVEIQNRYHCILQDVEKEVDAYLKSINNC